MNVETAAPLPSEAYDWYEFTGKTLAVNTSREVIYLRRGNIFGVRPSTNGKHVRLLLPDNVNRVMTISFEDAKKLAKMCTPVRRPRFT